MKPSQFCLRLCLFCASIYQNSLLLDHCLPLDLFLISCCKFEALFVQLLDHCLPLDLFLFSCCKFEALFVQLLDHCLPLDLFLFSCCKFEALFVQLLDHSLPLDQFLFSSGQSQSKACYVHLMSGMLAICPAHIISCPSKISILSILFLF